MTEVLLVSGSARRTSRTRALLEVVDLALRKQQAITVWADLSVEQFPPVDPRFHETDEPHPDPRVRSFVERARRADAIVLGTPVYHGSFSGILKNALDHLSTGDTMAKPTALVVSGGTFRSAQPCDHLRTVLRALHAYTIVNQVVAGDDDFNAPDPAGPYRLCSPEIVERVVRMANELVAVASALAPRRHELSRKRQSHRRESRPISELSGGDGR
ncbi:MAG: NADPH-dependent FMN reductase [Acidimicrobiales bacterium]